MLSRRLPLILTFWSLIFYMVHAGAAEPNYMELPDDIRYILEDMYGGDKNKWPKKVYAEDINGDGLMDWIAQVPECKKDTGCQVDLLLCNGRRKGKCSEFCLVGTGLLADMRRDVKKLICDSTC